MHILHSFIDVNMAANNNEITELTLDGEMAINELTLDVEIDPDAIYLCDC